MDVRGSFAAAARRLVGLAADGPEWRLLVAGPEPDAQRARAVAALAAQLEAGALVTAGLWRAAGVRHELLAAAYQPGQAVRRLRQVGEELGAVWEPDGALLPGLGDAVEVAGQGGQHVCPCVVAETEEPPVSFVDAVDVGRGQADAIGVILQVGRKLAYVGGALFLGGRRVARWYDCETLATTGR